MNQKTTKIKFNSLKLNFLNVSNKKDNFKNLKISFKRSKFVTNYYLEDKLIFLESKNSFIGTNKFNYKGNINLEPFDFKIDTEISKFDFKKFWDVKNYILRNCETLKILF